MVLRQLTRLLTDRFGCEEQDVEMGTLLEDLNLTGDDRDEIALYLWELYVTAPPPEELPPFETVEDLVGYIEDRME